MITREARDALEEALGDQLRFGAPLSRYTSLRVGGPAEVLATPASRDDLARLLRLCAAHRLRHWVLGGGFNTIAIDEPVEGVVIQMGRFRRLEERPGHRLRAEAGVSHASLVNFCSERGLGGLEFGAGIPGSIGGWLAMNAGIPDREVKDVAVEVEVMSPTGAHRVHLSRADLHFRYRALRGLAPGSVILSALLQASPSEPARVRAEVERMLAKRAASQPLNVPSCGSVFVNPAGDFAGRLIEDAGLKGLRIGGAQITDVHANFIANVGQARAADVLALIDRARSAVFQRSGRRLVPEVRVIGGKG